jgi:hypothetical protein
LKTDAQFLKAEDQIPCSLCFWVLLTSSVEIDFSLQSLRIHSRWAEQRAVPIKNNIAIYPSLIKDKKQNQSCYIN